jgi:glycosyltransferase involved in cell wall biosynthesis
MRRVLVISHTYVQPAHRGKLRALAARGLEVTVGVPQRWREPALGERIETAWERQSGLEVFPIPAKGGDDLATARFGRRALSALLRDKRPDLVQVEEEPSSAAARQVLAAARSLSVPVVLFTRQNVDPRLWLFERWGRRRTLRRLKGLVAGSEAGAELVRREVATLPVAVIPQLGAAVPADPVHAPHEGLAVGCVGRLVPRKGLDNLLQALARNRSVAWHLTVVGDGPERERLEQLASELRLAARIRWMGGLPAEQLARLWAELDVLVQPSRSWRDWQESNAHALVEAMAHEVAVLGTASGVIPETVGDAGVIVPAGDVAALAEQLVRLADDGARKPLAQAGRARALKLYSDDAVADRTVNFWRDLLEGRQPSAVSAQQADS